MTEGLDKAEFEDSWSEEERRGCLFLLLLFGAASGGVLAMVGWLFSSSLFLGASRGFFAVPVSVAAAIEYHRWVPRDVPGPVGLVVGAFWLSVIVGPQSLELAEPQEPLTSQECGEVHQNVEATRNYQECVERLRQWADETGWSP